MDSASNRQKTLKDDRIPDNLSMIELPLEYKASQMERDSTLIIKKSIITVYE